MRRVASSEDIVTDLCAALFAEFRRYDQRIRARQYMDGLLCAEGRKSIANIAAAVGVPGDEQRLHHFVSSSHWAWSPVRKALATFLEQEDATSAWVALPVSIPKGGEHTVGVARHFSPDGRQVVNGQRAYSMWYASERVVAPVSWRLHLPDAWLTDHRRRAKAEVPEELSAVTPEDCVAGLFDDVHRWGDPRRPVALDARGVDEHRHLGELFDQDAPKVVRISGRTRLVIDDRDRTGRGWRVAPAQAVLDTARRLRYVVRPTERQEGLRRMPLATATACVRLPAPPGQERGAYERPSRLSLLGVWHDLRRPPAELWLTNMHESPPASLLRTTRLARTVTHGWRTRGEAVGLRDYEGRSFQGWHRHMTLASCAYAMSALRSTGAAQCSGLSA
ncbi:IS701 family transposase [Streptomyces inhibens]|uniref:IS701 family transposase n=1 Tax=Streptomyces inhibens TaxID=2293571 RepID=UPI001EE73399|nr:transposase [Streptomyces inhibens]UKY53515.1 transposase [Streptomyces inhibens]